MENISEKLYENSKPNIKNNYLVCWEVINQGTTAIKHLWPLGSFRLLANSETTTWLYPMYGGIRYEMIGNIEDYQSLGNTPCNYIAIEDTVLIRNN